MHIALHPIQNRNIYKESLEHERHMNKEKIFPIFHSIVSSRLSFFPSLSRWWERERHRRREHTKKLNACPKNTALVLLALTFQMMDFLYFSYSTACFAATTTAWWWWWDGMMIVNSGMALSVELWYVYSFTTFSLFSISKTSDTYFHFYAGIVFSQNVLHKKYVPIY